MWMCGERLQFSQDNAMTVDLVGLTVWDSSIVVAKYLEKRVKAERTRTHTHFLHNKTCIELGAGLGVVGLSAGLLGAKVTITDTAWFVPAIERNLEINRDLLERFKACVCVKELYW